MSPSQPDRPHPSSGLLRLAEEFCPFAFLTLLAVPLLTVSCTPSGPEDFQELAAAHQATIEGEVRVPGLEAEVEVLRDPWGVPHIYAQSLDDLFFSQGYVQAQDRLWQMEMYRRAGEGRLSEILGPDALVHDRLARLLKYRGPWTDEEFSSYHPEGRRILDTAGRRSPTGRWPQPYAVILPGAGQPDKILSTETLAEVARHLAGRNLDVVDAWGPAEEPRAAEVA